MISVDGQFGRYKVLNSIGVGGMGEVFLAFDSELGRKVALKVLPKDVSGDQDRINRFIQEAKAVSVLNHPNILTVHDAGLADGIRFIATEFIEGETLREKLATKHLKLSEAIEIAVQIASALHFAHSKQIIHRDIKPENIMIRQDNVVKVLDFGLAKLNSQNPSDRKSAAPFEQMKTQAGMVLGTVGYMSPEQARGKPIDHRTDIFSFGVVLYEMLTGKQPFNGETASDVIAEILMKEPVSPCVLNSNIPREFERVITKAICKNRDQRYQTAHELLEVLKDLKLDADLQKKSDQQLLTNDIIETKTAFFDIHTDKTIQVETGVKGRLQTNKNFFRGLTETFKPTFKFRYSVPIILALILTVLVSYAIFAAFRSTPKAESVKLFKAGTDAVREGTYYKATKMFEEAVNRDKNYPNAHAGLAEAWLELDYVGRAQNEMLKVYEIESKNRNLLSSLYKTEDSLYFEAVNATLIRDYKQAISIYSQLAALNPSEPYVYLDLGRAYEKNEEIDKAIESYEKAVSLNSMYGAGFLRLGILFRRKADYEKSKQAFDKAENIYDRSSNDEGIAEVKYQRGVSLNFQEKLNDARTEFQQVIANPRANKYQQIRALLQISTVCSSLSETSCAEDYASKAISMAVQERMENLASNGLINLGNAFLALGDYEKAEQKFRQALELSRKDDGQHNEARALLSLGSLKIQQKRPEEAEEFVSQSLPFFQQGSYKKEVAQAKLILGRIYEKKGNHEAAFQAFAEVIDSDSASSAERAYAEMASGNLLMNREKYPQALSRYESSYELYKSLDNPYYTAYILLYLTDVLFQLGKFEEAEEKLSEVQEIIRKTPGYEAQFLPRIRLLNAQISLSRKDFANALNEARHAEKSGDIPHEIKLNKVVGLAQSSTKAGNPLGIFYCSKALDHAIGTNDLRTINLARLALAESYLKASNPLKAIDMAMQAKDYFVSTGNIESGWRSSFIVAEASRQNGDRENARRHALEAINLLNQLEKDWGQESFNNYLTKPNINTYYNQAEKLSKV
ncbi:MAG: prkC 3 [Acidobacteria bacterium]|nr:prkC 3 [Acidobacteriota bacterium]